MMSSNQKLVTKNRLWLGGSHCIRLCQDMFCHCSECRAAIAATLAETCCYCCCHFLCVLSLVSHKVTHLLRQAILLLTGDIPIVLQFIYPQEVPESRALKTSIMSVWVKYRSLDLMTGTGSGNLPTFT